MTFPAEKRARGARKPPAKSDPPRKQARPSPDARDWLAEAAAKAGLDTDALWSLRAWIAEQLLADEFAKLGQGGHTEDRVPLRRVFVDLPISNSPVTEAGPREARSLFLSRLGASRPFPLAALCDSSGGEEEELGEGAPNGGRVGGPGVLTAGRGTDRGFFRGFGTAQAGTLLIGGPGQGKSTLGQLACQIHRAALLRPRSAELPTSVRDVMHPFESEDDEGLSPPQEPLFPLQIVLPEAAAWLAARGDKGADRDAPALLSFLAAQPSARKAKLEAATLAAVAASMPVLLLLDGFDEVGSPEDRERVVAAAHELLTDLGRRDGTAVVVVTTRPQGYAGEMARLGVPLLPCYLAPLDVEEALEYAGKLVKVKILGADKQEAAMDKLRAAAKEGATGRLLRTPLQVTILAALVQQQGRVPSERWKLFWSYFDFTYRREIERESYASALLSERRAQIEAIHARTALLLQVEGENTGGTAARMSRKRLEDIAGAVLQEDGVADAERAELVRCIVDAAEKRLVFLVEPEPGGFGFEIRSLQEFMAAWALSEGRESAVEDRLLQVAKAPMFRNVVLFMASKLFSERSALREILADRVCGALDEDATDPLSRATREGALLALDLLEEGSALGQPKRARALMERACGLLDLPAGPEHARLVRVVNDDTAPVIRGAIESRLGRAAAGDAVSTLAVWSCLVAGAGLGEAWAIEVGEANWRSLKEPARLLDALANAGIPLGGWLTSKIEDEPAAFPPESLIRLLPNPGKADEPDTAAPEGAGWLENILGYLQRDVRNVITSREGWRLPVRFLPPRGELGFLAGLTKMLSPPPAWDAWVAAGRFAAEPSAALLAETLRAAAKTLQPSDWPLLAWNAPWPLATCLRSADTPGELGQWAAVLSRGELGDAEDWYRAQGRWQEGWSLSAAIEAAAGESPWSLASLENAPPLVFLEVHFGAAEYAEGAPGLLEMAARAFRASQRASSRAVLADVCFRLLQASPRARKLPPLEISEWAKVVRTAPFWLVKRPPQVPEAEWLKAVDILGVRRLGAFGVGLWEIAQAYACLPENFGFLHWLSIGALISRPGVLDDKQLTTLKEALAGRTYESTPARADVAAVRTWLGAVNASEVDQVLNDIAVQAESEPSVWYRFLHTLSSGKLSSSLRESMLLGLYNRLGPSHPAALRTIQGMRGALQSRRSGLASAATWNRLGLPLPYPVVPSTTARLAALPDNPVVLRKLHVEHVRVLGDLDLVFDPPPADKGQWIVVLGPNGVGKTTLLRSLVLALRNLSDPKIWPKGTFASPWHENGEPREAKITVDVAGHAEHATRIRSNGTESFSQTPPQDAPRLFPLFAYGCRRGSAFGGAARAVDLDDDDGPEVATLFDEGASLIHADTWLVRWHSDAADRARAKIIFDAIREGLRRLLDLDSVEVRRQGVWVSGAAVGQSIPFSALSDGYITTAGWFIDLLARWITLAERLEAPITADFMKEMTGLVLLDEIDLHLHPRWQVDAIGRAREVLPRMSFVVTTHNPLTLVGARPEEIRILSLEGGKVRAERGTESPMLLTGGQLFSRYFGIHDIYPNELGRKLRRYSFLTGYPLRTTVEQAEMESLRAELRKAGIDPGWDEVPRTPLSDEKASEVKTARARKKPRGQAS